MDAVNVVAWRVYATIGGRPGLRLFVALLITMLIMGACHKTYDDWMNN